MGVRLAKAEKTRKPEWVSFAAQQILHMSIV